MATRSRIGYVSPKNGKIVSAYCHWDGYPSGNGKTLMEHYNTFEKVKALVDQGDMSSLSEKCDKPEGHTFDKPVEGYTIYYGRDRGERGVKAQKSPDHGAFLLLADECGAEFAYLFENGKWFCTNLGYAPKLSVLTEKHCRK